MMKTIEERILNILLAEDDSDDRLFLQEAVAFLKLDNNVSIDTVKDGQELMRQLKGEGMRLPDILFLDLNMPRKSGIECLEEIRNNRKLKDIPVIIFTTSRNEGDINECYKKGANLYLRKPSKFSDLTVMMRKIYNLDWEKHKPHSNKKEFVWEN